MILMIDNYDSFTYNLVQYLGELGAEVETVRNDAVDIEDIKAPWPDGIFVSSGRPRPTQYRIPPASGRLRQAPPGLRFEGYEFGHARC
jgi:anthranilate/para-aminobenzoate synthase component II